MAKKKSLKRRKKTANKAPAPRKAELKDIVARVPVSACAGISWPALPSAADSRLLSLEYQLDQTQWWPPEVLQNFQLRQLEHVLAHGVRTVPFYRNRFRDLGKLRRGGLTMEAWRRIPILKRQEAQGAGQDLFSRNLPKDHRPANRVTTSGSTGQPITVVSTQVTKLFFIMMRQRYHQWHGRDFSAKMASIHILSDAAAEGEARKQQENWIHGYPCGPTVHLDIMTVVSEQLVWLQQQNPDYLFTYPTNLAALLRLSESTGKKPGKLRQVLVGGEVMSPGLRQACKDTWGASITESYGAIEVGMISLQCPDHLHHHVQSENVFVEILNEDDEPCVAGEIGRVVCTPLNNFANPLVRYEIGDFAQVGETCSCGRGLPVLTSILGRARNMATLPSGEQFWPRLNTEAMTRFAPVRQVQVVQRTVNDIEVRVVAPGPLTGEEENQLREMILERLRHFFTVNIVYVDEIPRSAGGKFEDFLSLIDT